MNDNDAPDAEQDRDYEEAVRKGRIGRFVIVLVLAAISLGYAALMFASLI